MIINTFPLRSTSSAALRTPPQACLSHGFRALMTMMMMMMKRRKVVVSTVLMMESEMMMKYQSSLW